jgi:hypothetical protein
LRRLKAALGETKGPPEELTKLLARGWTLAMAKPHECDRPAEHNGMFISFHASSPFH